MTEIKYGTEPALRPPPLVIPRADNQADLTASATKFAMEPTDDDVDARYDRLRRTQSESSATISQHSTHTSERSLLLSTGSDERTDYGSNQDTHSIKEDSEYPSELRKSPQRRPSILRMGSLRPQSARGLRKSASVEFVIDIVEPPKTSGHIRRYSGSSLRRDMPRRLTWEEREALYKIRPDLEIEPSGQYRQNMEAAQRRAQKRMIFSMFGGLFSVLLLIVFYYLLSHSNA